MAGGHYDTDGSDTPDCEFCLGLGFPRLACPDEQSRPGIRETERQPSIHRGNRPIFQGIACHYCVTNPSVFRSVAIAKLLKFFEFMLHSRFGILNKRIVEYVFVHEYIFFKRVIAQ